jgi:hypothetical protein
MQAPMYQQTHDLIWAQLTLTAGKQDSGEVWDWRHRPRLVGAGFLGRTDRARASRSQKHTSVNHEVQIYQCYL